MPLIGPVAAALNAAFTASIVTGHHPRYAAAAQLIGEVQGLPRIVTLAKPVPLATLRAALATVDPTVGGMLLKT